METQQKKKRGKNQAADTNDPNGRNGFPKVKVDVVSKVIDLIEPLCETEGLELVHVEYQREAGGKVLRLFIDRQGGVTLDDCVRISRQTGDILDVYLEGTGPYSLQVSSPGLNRPLGRERDYEKFAGRTAKIRTMQSIEGRKNFTGVLKGICEGIVTLAIGDVMVDIPFDQIAKANLVESPKGA